MKELFIGLISGTSVDSIDSVIISLSKRKMEILNQSSTHIEKELKKKILNDVIDNNLSDEKIIELDNELGQAFGEAALSLLKKKFN